MLLELTRWLQQLESLFGLFGYLTFRGILAALTSLFLSLWLGPAAIRRLAQFKGGQPIRQDGPQTHFTKAGTPTMGGSLILVTVLLSTRQQKPEIAYVLTDCGARLLVHEAALAAFGAAEALKGDKVALQYTTTSPRLHQLLGVAPASAPSTSA